MKNQQSCWFHLFFDTGLNAHQKHIKTTIKIALGHVSIIFDTCHLPLIGEEAQISERNMHDNWFLSYKTVSLHCFVLKQLDICQVVYSFEYNL